MPHLSRKTGKAYHRVPFKPHQFTTSPPHHIFSSRVTIFPTPSWGSLHAGRQGVGGGVIKVHGLSEKFPHIFTSSPKSSYIC